MNVKIIFFLLLLHYCKKKQKKTQNSNLLSIKSYSDCIFFSLKNEAFTTRHKKGYKRNQLKKKFQIIENSTRTDNQEMLVGWLVGWVLRHVNPLGHFMPNMFLFTNSHYLRTHFFFMNTIFTNLFFYELMFWSI